VAEFYTDSKMSELILKLAGDVTVRGTINADGDHVGSVYNFINLACNKRGKYAYNVWDHLTSEKSGYKDELEELVTYEYLKGLSTEIQDLSNTKKTRRRKTPVMTLRGLQRLMMILGGRVASEFRQIVEGVFTRYMGGDKSMLEEIQANAASDAPIHQAYRQALAQEPVVNAAGTKRQLEREDALFEFDGNTFSLHYTRPAMTVLSVLNFNQLAILNRRKSWDRYTDTKRWGLNQQ